MLNVLGKVNLAEKWCFSRYFSSFLNFLNILLELCFSLKEDPPHFVFLKKEFLKNQ